MANIYKMNKGYTGVASIVLSKLLYLDYGSINNSSPSVDVTLTGDTTLMTAPSGITGIDLSLLSIQLLGSNTTGNLIASIGTNSPNFDNILQPTTFTGFNTIGDVWPHSLREEAHRVLPGEVITMRVTNAVSGVGAIVNVFMVGKIVTP